VRDLDFDTGRAAANVLAGQMDEEPAGTGDDRWDVFPAALAEHLTARDGRSAPVWAESRSLRQLWFPFSSRAARIDAVGCMRRRHFAAVGCMSRRRRRVIGLIR
jgi:hypothetical protein